MAKKQPRIYFDHKAEITKTESNRERRPYHKPSGDGFEFEWKVDSQLSWDTFVQKWEDRPSSRPSR
jgi:hypothetical protein